MIPKNPPECPSQKIFTPLFAVVTLLKKWMKNRKILWYSYVFRASGVLVLSWAPWRSRRIKKMNWMNYRNFQRTQRRGRRYGVWFISLLHSTCTNRSNQLINYFTRNRRTTLSHPIHILDNLPRLDWFYISGSEQFRQHHISLEIDVIQSWVVWIALFWAYFIHNSIEQIFSPLYKIFIKPFKTLYKYDLQCKIDNF